MFPNNKEAVIFDHFRQEGMHTLEPRGMYGQ